MHIIVENFSVCDFSKMTLNVLTCYIGRILRSQSYESDLAAYGDRFENNKQELQLRLTVRTNLKLNQVTDSLSVMMLFNLVRSPKEKELMELIDKEGGASKGHAGPCSPPEDHKRKREQQQGSRCSPGRGRPKACIISPSRDSSRPPESHQTNETAFIRKFEAQKKSLIDALRENVDRWVIELSRRYFWAV